MNLTGTLGGLQLEAFVIPFIETPLENSQDNTTLDFTMYTDFINRKREWELNWKVLTEDQYDDLKAVYDSQFTTHTYPTFVVSYYSISTPVRMYINPKDIQRDGCQIRDVQVRLVEETGF